MVLKQDIATTYKSNSDIPIIDVRSPGEFEKGHIPGAMNIPLFTNAERAIVGTAYKQQSREKAIEIGTEIVKPKLQWFIDESNKVAKNNSVIVHCWRGGMRSASFAQHIHDNGIEHVSIIEGGYKAFRNHVLDFFKQSFTLRILGGYTGSGKTFILKEIEKLGKQVIDLEGIAHHKGSAFGSIGESQQPTVEQFENNLFFNMNQMNIKQPIWIEDESHNIGKVKIPIDLFSQIRAQKLLFIDIPKEERAKHLVTEYSQFGNDVITKGINAISKRLGGQNVKLANEYLLANDYYSVAYLALQYYDKAYSRGMNSRDPKNVQRILLETTNHTHNAKYLLNLL